MGEVWLLERPERASIIGEPHEDGFALVVPAAYRRGDAFELTLARPAESLLGCTIAPATLRFARPDPASSAVELPGGGWWVADVGR